MRNNAAYLPENPIVYIIFPESIHNRASLFIYQVQMELGIQSDSILLLVCYRLVLTKTRLRWKSGNTLLDD